MQKRLRPGIPGYQRKHFTFTFSESCRKALAAAESLSDSSEDEADTEASKRDIQLSTPVRERSNRRSRLTLRPGVGREIPRFRFHFTPIPPSSSDSEEEEQRFSNLTHFTAIEGLPERWLTKPAEMPYSQVETVPNEDNCEKMFSQMSLEKRNQVQPFEASPKGIDCDESISGQPPIDPFWQEQPLDISISEDAIRTTHQNLSQSQPFQMQPENEIQMPEIDASVQEIPEYIAPIEVEEDAVSIAGNQRQQSVNDLQTHVVHAEVDSWMLPDMADDDPRDEDDTMRIEGASEVDRPNVPPRTKRRTTTLRMRKEYKRSSLLGTSFHIRLCSRKSVQEAMLELSGSMDVAEAHGIVVNRFDGGRANAKSMAENITH